MVACAYDPHTGEKKTMFLICIPKKILWLTMGSLLFLTSTAMAVEEPPFEILLSEPPFEYRRYPGFVVAETILSGDFDSASRTGFKRIAGYIFGGNRLETGDSRKIAMTAPVTVEPKEDGWRVHFVMPSAESVDTLPMPTSPEVSLRRIPQHEAAIIRFSGWTTESAIQEQTLKLNAWMASKNLKPSGPPQVARYNDPFTLPWRRRNEILIQITQ
jgi:hypothetical protein